MKTKTFKMMAFLMLSFALPYLTFAQGEPPEIPDETMDTPIDSWLVVLMVAGAIYGAVKIWKTKRTLATAKIAN